MTHKILNVLFTLALLLSFSLGMAVPPAYAAAAWTAYNDCSGTTGGNTTAYTIPSGTGLLKNYDTGVNTAVTATFTSYNSPTAMTTTGAVCTSGTDAYNTFNGKANMVGVIQYGSTAGWYVDVSFTGLNSAKTYTFATSANRAGGTGGSPTYTTRISKFTISDEDAATNASTSGVTVISNLSVSFCTGENTANGYVARWTGIQPGSDGDFKVRVESAGTVNEAYGPSVFMLQEESTTPTIGFSPSSFTFSATQGGANPSTQSLSISNSGGGTLNWSLSDNATWLSLAPTSGTGAGSSTLTVDITGLSIGTYNASITISATGASNTPQTVPVTLNILPPPPAAPSGLTATAASSSQINLSWTDNSGDETGFRIERKTGASGTYAEIATTSAGVTTYNNSGLSPSTLYYYQVRAYNAGGNSAYSNEASATTPSPYWTAYNDCAWSSGQSNTNITQISINMAGEPPTASGTLIKRADGSTTSVTATTTLSSPHVSGTDFQVTTSGIDAASGTDAYTTFNGNVSTVGVVNGMGATSGWYIDLTLSGLDPAKTYTFAGTTVRNGGYTTRNSTFILSGDDAATNASTSTVTVVNAHTIAFNTGVNTQGNVVRWTGINPGSDGTIVIRARASTTAEISGSIANAYGLSVFMLQEEASSNPTITITGTPLSAFSSAPGTPSSEQSYTVSGSNLTNDIAITAPADFEISKTSGSGFASSLVLSQSGGSVAATTIYVRFNRATEGTSSGNITHASTGATTQNVAVTGTATTPPTAPSGLTATAASSTQINLNWTDNSGNETGFRIERKTGSGGTYAEIATTGAGVNSYNDSSGLSPSTLYYYQVRAYNAGGNSAYSNEASATTQSSPPWTAYNDCAVGTGESTTNITTYSVSSPTSGLLKNYATGADTTVTAAFTISGGPTKVTGNGAECNSGTDAYTTFNGKAGMVGVINYGSTTGWYVDVTFTGLNTAKTYTFATSANRNNSSYSNRISKFTISDVASATNASTSGVTVINNESVSFCTGDNTASGYVARWTGIQPGADGDFTVRAESGGTVNEAYGPGVFMLQEEAATTPTITITGTPLSAFSSAPGTPSAEQSYTVSGSNLTAGITVTAPTDFEISTTSGSGFASSSLVLPQSGGSVTATPIYVRFLRDTEGTSTGNITHTSTGATTQNVAVSGTAGTTPAWTAYNDCAYIDGQTTTNITTYECYTNNTSGLLKNYADGANTPVTMLVNTSGTVESQLTSSYYGAETNSGTDAYTTFHDYVNMVGGERLTPPGYVDVTFSGLDPAKTYTFATTANRANSDYTTRLTKFTLSDEDAATNASTSGVTVNSNLSVSFCTGYNTVNGYVARWTGIQPGSDGDFNVRFEVDSGDYAYGPAVLMLQEESVASTAPVVADIPNQTVAEGGSFATISLDNYVSDVDNTDDQMTWTFSGNTELTVNINASRVATITIPSPTWTGAETITFRATDPGALWDADAATFTVTAGNAAPVVTDIPDQTVAAGGSFATISLDNYVSDVDNTDDQMTWTYTGSSALTVNIVSRVATITIPSPTWTGAETITFRATDPGALWDDDAATFTVTAAVNQAPNQPTLVSPGNGSTGVSTSPTLQVTVSDPDADNLNVTFYGRKAGTGSGEDFRITVIPDSQNESTSYPAVFNSMTQWIANNKSGQNIVFTTHVGDIVNTSTSTTEWTNADTAMDYLDAGNVAYSVGPGNHDMGGLYNNYFGTSRFSGKSWYGGHYGSDNYNNYSLFSAGGMDFILINLQYSSTSAMLDWADALLKANPTRRGIVEQHDLLNLNNTWDNQAPYTALKDNPNLFLMLCGHMHSCFRWRSLSSGIGR